MDHLGHDLTEFLVTGAGGYLGGRVLAMLRNRNRNALGVDKSESCDLVCDLCDHDATTSMLAQHPDSTVIHCAAAVPKSRSGYLDEAAANESLNMVRQLARAGPRRVIFISSMTVYPDGTLLAQEHDAASTGKGYAASKLEAERVFLERRDVSTTILRLPGLFGLPRRGGVLFNSALTLARGEVPALDAELPQWAAMHVDDAAELCVRAATMPAIASMVMNAGYPERMSISAAVGRLAGLFGRTLHLPAPKWFEFDLSRLHAELGSVVGRFADRLNDLAEWAQKDVANDPHS